MKEIWFDDDNRTILVRYPDGTSKSDPNINLSETKIQRVCWDNGKLIFDNPEPGSYPRDLPMSYALNAQPMIDEDTPSYDDSMILRMTGSIANSLSNYTYKSRGRGEYTHLINEDKLGCSCLPVHHGHYIPALDAIVDTELAPFIWHLLENHEYAGDNFPIVSSCQGGEHDHGVSFTDDNKTGYIAMTVDRNMIEAFGEDRFFLDHDIIENYPTWVDCALSFHSGGQAILAWQTEEGMNEVLRIIESCCDNVCAKDIASKTKHVKSLHCDWCNMKMDKYVKLAV